MGDYGAFVVHPSQHSIVVMAFCLIPVMFFSSTVHREACLILKAKNISRINSALHFNNLQRALLEPRILSDLIIITSGR